MTVKEYIAQIDDDHLLWDVHGFLEIIFSETTDRPTLLELKEMIKAELERGYEDLMYRSLKEDT